MPDNTDSDETAKPEDPSSQIARRAGWIALGTLASRILGASRDMVIAATIAVQFTDAFWLAFTIPNALRVLLGEGAVSGAFVPVLTQVRQQRGHAEARRVYARLVGAMMLVLAVVSVLGVLSAPWLVTLYGSGLEPEIFELTVGLTQIVFPYIGLVGVAALVMGALHASKRFVAASFAPAMLNVALISAALLLPATLETLGRPAVFALAFGALAGGVLHILAQLPSLKKAGFLVRPRLDLKDPDVRRTFVLMGPLLIALGVYQVNIVASRQLASYLGAGAISFLFYGQRLVEIPQGMFALAIGSAALPTLAEHAARGEMDQAKSLFRRSLGLSLFVAIPSTVALMVLAQPIVAVLFGRGAFSPLEVEQTARSLVFLAAGIWAVASVRTIVPLFHSLGDTRSPVHGSAVNLVVFASVSLLTMDTLGHVGLALAISLASTAQLLTLLWMLRRRVGSLELRSVFLNAARVWAASLLMGGVCALIVRQGSYDAFSLNGALWLGFAVAGGMLVFGVLASVFGCPEFDIVQSVLGRRLKRR